jgi:hypothetical protein
MKQNSKGASRLLRRFCKPATEINKMQADSEGVNALWEFLSTIIK